MLFEGVVLLFDFDRTVSFKEKTNYKNTVLSHEGSVSFSLNKKVSLTSVQFNRSVD